MLMCYKLLHPQDKPIYKIYYNAQGMNWLYSINKCNELRLIHLLYYIFCK